MTRWSGNTPGICTSVATTCSRPSAWRMRRKAFSTGWPQDLLGGFQTTSWLNQPSPSMTPSVFFRDTGAVVLCGSSAPACPLPHGASLAGAFLPRGWKAFHGSGHSGSWNGQNSGRVWAEPSHMT